MKLFFSEQINQIRTSANAIGIDTILLIEMAAKQLVEYIQALQEQTGYTRVLVLCGEGDNAAEGYSVARQLLYLGVDVTVLENYIESEELAPEIHTMRQACLPWLAASKATTNLNDAQKVLTSANQAPLRLRPATLEKELAYAPCLVVDAIAGSTLSYSISGVLADVVKVINQASDQGQIAVLSIDVPTGIRVDSSELPKVAVKADLTVQLTGAKLASLFYPARAYYGQIVTVPTGIPQNMVDAHSPIWLLDTDTVLPFWRPISQDVHKYDVGTVLVVAGSSRYRGSAVMTCHGALRAGAGLVTLLTETTSEHEPVLPQLWSEVIVESYSPAQGQENTTDTIIENISKIPPQRAQAIVVGPGLSPEIGATISKFIAYCNENYSHVPLILDAGALPALDEAQGGSSKNATHYEDWLAAVQAHPRVVLTPHIGEAARLLGKDVASVKDDMLDTACELAQKTRATVVLKSATTVIAYPLENESAGNTQQKNLSQSIFSIPDESEPEFTRTLFYKDCLCAVSTSNNVGMATGGTGDVLAGVVGTMVTRMVVQDSVAQSGAVQKSRISHEIGAGELPSIFTQTCLAVYLHTQAGALAYDLHGDSILPQDIIAQLSQAKKQFVDELA